MPRFDVFRNAGGDANFPLLVDVQADLLDELHTRVVVPLMREAASGAPISGLHPIFTLDENRYTFRSELIGSVRISQLKQRVGSLAAERDRVVTALDFLFQGF